MTAAGGGEPIGTDGRFRLHTDRPLDHLNGGQGQAFAVTDGEDESAARYAMVLPLGQPHRERLVGQLLQRPCHGTLCPLAAGLVGEAGGRRMALVFERPEGGSLGQAGLILPEQEIVGGLLPPLFDAIEALAVRHFNHRRIRPGTIFFLDAKHTRIVLGECVSAPPAFDQPRLFEPTERALAMREGRGEGALACDLYALGVTIAALILGLDVAAIAEDATPRIAQGSYAALVGRARLIPQMEVLLRGLLADDVAARWGLEEIRRWRGGTTDVPRQRGIGRRAPYGFPFRGTEWRVPRLLASELAQHRREALIAMREPAMELWLRHALGDVVMADEARRAVTAHQESPGDALADDLLVARVCRALDPQGPLRFRDLAVMEDGLAPVLAQAVASGDRPRLKTLSDLISGPLLVESTPVAGAAASLAKPFTLALQSWARDVSLGAGLERCLYEMCPQAPCYSPLLGGESENVEAILRALDRVIEDRSPAKTVFDRHIAAFIASRSRMLERRVMEITRNDGDPVQQSLAIILLLGELQAYFKIGPLRKLAAWSAAQLVPGIRQLRRASLRQHLLDDLPSLAVAGDLQRVVQGLNLSQMLREDRQGFQEAVNQYRQLGRAIAGIDAAATARAATAYENGQWISALIAVLCLGLSLGSVVLRLL